MFNQSRHCTDISKNAKYLLLFNNFRDKKQFTYLANEVNPEDRSISFKAYLDAKQRAHSYILLDLTRVSDDRLWFRTNVFQQEYPPVMYAAVDDETNKSELLCSSLTKISKSKIEDSHNF